VYWVGRDNKVKEWLMPDNQAGGLTAEGYMVAPGSTMLYAVMNGFDKPRVGFQSFKAPVAITEAAFDGKKWSVGTLTL
jgi:hypothetical protein